MHLIVIAPGKSCFLFYVLLLRLSKRRPTALQMCSESSYIVFSESGTYTYSLSGSDPSTLPEGTWALLDSNERGSLPCITFLEATYTDRAQLLVVSSLAEEHHKEWVKEFRIATFIMDHFSPSEFIQLG